jgi:hypothetical protein
MPRRYILSAAKRESLHHSATPRCGEPFPCIGFDPVFEYKQLREFRGLNAAKQPSRTYSWI